MINRLDSFPLSDLFISLSSCITLYSRPAAVSLCYRSFLPSLHCIAMGFSFLLLYPNPNSHIQEVSYLFPVRLDRTIDHLYSTLTPANSVSVVIRYKAMESWDCCSGWGKMVICHRTSVKIVCNIPI